MQLQREDVCEGKKKGIGKTAAAAIHDRETYHNGESLFYATKIQKNLHEKVLHCPNRCAIMGAKHVMKKVKLFITPLI